MSRLICLFTSLALMTFAVPTASAQDLADEVRNYFPGKWSSDGEPNGDGSVTWELVAGGKAVAGPGMTDKTGASFGMGGWRAAEKKWVHTWFTEDGGWGVTKLNRYEGKTFFGTTTTEDGEGTMVEGAFEIAVKDRAHFTSTVKSKSGEQQAEWKRVKK